MEHILQAVERQIMWVTGAFVNEIDFEHPADDPGWYGPDSTIWQVHGDFTSMLCGGISALLLQMLHPLALAGVWDHSTFRHDMLGRLRRTSQFIAATTFAPGDIPDQRVARVRAIHDQIHGVTPDGIAYRASSPELLTWVHVAECSRFMAAHQRYRCPQISAAEQDRYYREAAQIARALGAGDVPETASQVADYLESMRPQLRCDERTRNVVTTLLAAPVPTPLARPVKYLVMQAGVDLLPEWAARQLSFNYSLGRRRAVRGGVVVLGRVLRAAVKNGVWHRAMRRMGRLP